MTALAISHSPPQSAAASPRSSTSSSACQPLTPMLERTSTINGISLSSEVTSDEVSHDVAASRSKTSDLSPTTAFSTFSFAAQPGPTSSVSTQLPDVSLSELPKAGFSFGTCPSAPFLGTPTAEMGPFDYPDVGLHDLPRSASPPPPLGQTHRRGSIVQRGCINPRATTRRHESVDRDGYGGWRDPSDDRRPSHPSPPATRRSSTLSSITTIPSAGRRPSILHSSTNPSLFPSSSPTTSRRSSLMFPPKALPLAIPPSLLARRGSVPASQLFGLPTGSLSGVQPNKRASFAAPGSAGFDTTTPAIYNRRESTISESGASSGSSGTITRFSQDATRRSSTRMEGVNPARRESVRVENSTPGSPISNSRRSSLPFLPNLPPAQSALATGRIPQPFPPNPHRTSLSEYSPPSPFGRYKRQSSTSTRGSLLSSGLSLSSSEESNEEDEETADPLPTPDPFGLGGSTGNGPSFTDPWAHAGKGVFGPVGNGEGKKQDEGEDGEKQRWSTTGRGGRPPLETISSDDTERGHPSP